MFFGATSFFNNFILLWEMERMEKKDFKEIIRNLPLSVPMGLATIGTVASLWFANKRIHMLCGTVWLGISAIHTWQHCPKVKKDVAKVMGKMGIRDFFNIPKNKFDLFIRSVEISSYIPGRVRLYSKALIGNQEKCDSVLNFLQGIGELDEVKVNKVSGSILIIYRPEILRTNQELIRVEEYIRTHVGR